MEPLIEAMSGDTISQILLRNNQAVMMCYKGDVVVAVQKIDKLYAEIRYIDDVDDYYPYIVGNNYHIIRYLAGLSPIDHVSLESVFRFHPLDHDRNYFSTRQRIMFERIERGQLPERSTSNWNILSEPLVGPAWSFWGDDGCCLAICRFGATKAFCSQSIFRQCLWDRSLKVQGS